MVPKPFPFRFQRSAAPVYSTVVAVTCADGRGRLFDVLLAPNPLAATNLAADALFVETRLSGAFAFPSVFVEAVAAHAQAMGTPAEVAADIHIQLVHPLHQSQQYSRLVEGGRTIVEFTYPDKFPTIYGSPVFAFVVAIAGSVRAAHREHPSDAPLNETAVAMLTFKSAEGAVPGHDSTYPAPPAPGSRTSPFNYTLVDLTPSPPVTSAVNKGVEALSGGGTIANMSRIQNTIGWVVSERSPAVPSHTTVYEADLRCARSSISILLCSCPRTLYSSPRTSPSSPTRAAVL